MSCVFHMWLNTSTLQTTPFLISKFFRTKCVWKPEIWTQEENIRGLTKQNVELPEAAEQGDNIGIYSPGLLESSLRSAGWRLHRGLPTSRLLPKLLLLSDITHRRRQTESFFLSPSGKNSLKFSDVYEGGGIFYFLFFTLINYFEINLRSLPPSSTPFLTPFSVAHNF